MKRAALELPRTRAKHPPRRNLEVIPGKTAGNFTLLVKVGARTTVYAVQELNVGTTPGRGFTLLKAFGGSDPGQERYDVFISTVVAPGEGDHCTCTGFLHHGHCKHADALRTLVLDTPAPAVPHGTADTLDPETNR